MLSEKGFSLIEILISLTILSVSAIAISHFFNQSSDISAYSNNKLVATNLARMTLVRVQHDYGSFQITKNTTKRYDKSTCTTLDCRNLYETTINNANYSIEIQTTAPTAEELEIKLFPVNVKVNYITKQGMKSTAVEGYVKDAG